MAGFSSPNARRYKGNDIDPDGDGQVNSADSADTSADADTLDGVEGANYARSDVAETLTGLLAVNGTGLQGGVKLENPNGGIDYRLLQKDDGTVNITDETNGVNLAKVSTNGFTYTGNTVWHAGNDGDGSGLDADTVDGQHASDIGGSGWEHVTQTTNKTIDISASSYDIYRLYIHGIESDARIRIDGVTSGSSDTGAYGTVWEDGSDTGGNDNAGRFSVSEDTAYVLTGAVDIYATGSAPGIAPNISVYGKSSSNYQQRVLAAHIQCEDDAAWAWDTIDIVNTADSSTFTVHGMNL